MAQFLTATDIQFCSLARRDEIARHLLDSTGAVSPNRFDPQRNLGRVRQEHRRTNLRTGNNVAHVVLDNPHLRGTLVTYETHQEESAKAPADHGTGDNKRHPSEYRRGLLKGTIGHHSFTVTIGLRRSVTSHTRELSVLYSYQSSTNGAEYAVIWVSWALITRRFISISLDEGRCDSQRKKELEKWYQGRLIRPSGRARLFEVWNLPIRMNYLDIFRGKAIIEIAFTGIQG